MVLYTTQYSHVHVHPHALTAPGDYQPVNREITITPDSNAYTVSIPTVADTIVETPETFAIVLTNSSANTVILQPMITVIIVDGNGKN